MGYNTRKLCLVTFVKDVLRIHNLLLPHPYWFRHHCHQRSFWDRHLAWCTKGDQLMDPESMTNLK